jgi:hypothetical protein
MTQDTKGNTIKCPGCAGDKFESIFGTVTYSMGRIVSGRFTCKTKDCKKTFGYHIDHGYRS